MVEKKTHNTRSLCPVACGLDVVGDHWSLLIIRDLLFFGRHEYKDMLKSEEGISSNILSDRLNKLQRKGVVKSIPHPESKKRKLYYLTPMGKDLIYVLISLSLWSLKHLPETVAASFDADVENKGPKELAKYLLAQAAEWEKSYGIEHSIQ
ncbi:MAG: winged helix-turn-helix transcriptional regulator [Cellvibrionaceae bacterium]